MILHPIEASAWPGLSSLERGLWKGAVQVGCQQPVLRDPAGGSSRRGPAWEDAAFAEELRHLHRRCGAGAASLKNLEMILKDGAEVVVTGQQPAILGGPLYSAAKIAQALAFARARSAAGNRTVALFWSAADDSDFEEMGHAWLFGPQGPVMARAERSEWEPGIPMGDLPASALIRPGQALWTGLGGKAQRVDQALETAREQRDWGEASLAFLLKLFAEDGLVVLDARSSGLRSLGRELFASYAERAESIGRAVIARGAELSAEGGRPAIAPASALSGLYALDRKFRRKLSPADLSRGLGEGVHSPGVLLRAVWQDHLLAPVAAILGPGEMAYHRQLPPVYEALGVEAAAPIPRFHLGLWPESPAFGGDHALLRGGSGAQSILGSRRRPASQADALADFRRELEATRAELESRLPENSRRVEAFSRRMKRELQRMEFHLDRDALAAAGGSRWADYLAWRGVAQERRLSLVEGWRLAGENFPLSLRAAADAAVHSLAKAEGFGGWILEGSQA